MPLRIEDRRALEEAKRLLENPGFAAKATNFLGTPIERGMANLPDGLSKGLVNRTQAALEKARDVALCTMEDANRSAANNAWHQVAATAAGAAGGAFGMAGLVAELPLSTTIMLRSIADIARSNGESIANPETKAECLTVFAMGGSSKSNDAAETGFFAARLALAEETGKAAKFLANQAVVKKGSPALAKFMATIANRLGVQETQKAAAQLVPVIGAAGGAAINWLFMDHFQGMARGHFTVRRLERKYGSDAIWEEFSAMDIEQPCAAGN